MSIHQRSSDSRSGIKKGNRLSAGESAPHPDFVRLAMTSPNIIEYSSFTVFSHPFDVDGELVLLSSQRKLIKPHETLLPKTKFKDITLIDFHKNYSLPDRKS
ncbi:hypothetical protein NPIL_590161 [Nephila pilipes]|uniref:Uncharacterized protein n=1 Tax=Nephila pilipes TaxID=299642 RepID=A0A8X6TKP5_NEPPI|nr:hypothetical protein NPIL_590161 [Nephila pilipes]